MSVARFVCDGRLEMLLTGVQIVEVWSPINRSTAQCVRPTLELWNDRLKQVFAAPEPLSCSKVEQDWVDVDNGSLRVSDSAVKRHGSVVCQYTPVHRGRNDYEVKETIILPFKHPLLLLLRMNVIATL